MSKNDDSGAYQRTINRNSRKQSEINTSSTVGPQSVEDGDLSYEGTASDSMEFDEDGNLVEPKTYEEEVVESATKTEMELLKAYREAETISDAAELLDKPATSVATSTLDILQDEYGLVRVEHGDVEYTMDGKSVIQHLEPDRS